QSWPTASGAPPTRASAAPGATLTPLRTTKDCRQVPLSPPGLSPIAASVDSRYRAARSPPSVADPRPSISGAVSAATWRPSSSAVGGAGAAAARRAARNRTRARGSEAKGDERRIAADYPAFSVSSLADGLALTGPPFGQMLARVETNERSK